MIIKMELVKNNKKVDARYASIPVHRGQTVRDLMNYICDTFAEYTNKNLYHFMMEDGSVKIYDPNDYLKGNCGDRINIWCDCIRRNTHRDFHDVYNTAMELI